jgi:hypothetical protein
VCELEMHSWLGMNCSNIKAPGDIWSKHGLVCPEHECCVLNYGWLGSPNLLDICHAHLQSVLLVTASADQILMVLWEAFTCYHLLLFHMSLFTFLSPNVLVVTLA